MLSTILPRLHFLLYSTLLGTELFQTFILTKVSFQALPRPVFITLQKRLFPVYFRIQALFLVLTAVTFPPRSLSSLCETKLEGALFFVAGVTAMGNLIVYEPRTQAAMDAVAKAGQERKAKKGSESEDAALEMKRLKRDFSRNHAMSIHLNLMSVGAMVVYGWRLAGRLGV